MNLSFRLNGSMPTSGNQILRYFSLQLVWTIYLLLEQQKNDNTKTLMATVWSWVHELKQINVGILYYSIDYFLLSNPPENLSSSFCSRLLGHLWLTFYSSKLLKDLVLYFLTNAFFNLLCVAPIPFFYLHVIFNLLVYVNPCIFNKGVSSTIILLQWSLLNAQLSDPHIIMVLA